MIFQQTIINFSLTVFAWSSSSLWWNDGHHAGCHHWLALAQGQEYGTKGIHGGHPNHGSDGLPLDPTGVVNDLEGDAFHLPNDVDHHHQRVLAKSDPSDTPVNPTNFSGYTLNPARTPYVAQDADDTCGLTCRGPDEYAFGLYSCLRSAFEKNGMIPNVTIGTSIRENINDIVLPKVVFSPATSLEKDASGREKDPFVLDNYNKARKSWVNSRLPSAILFAESITDVQHGVNCAR